MIVMLNRAPPPEWVEALQRWRATGVGRLAIAPPELVGDQLLIARGALPTRQLLSEIKTLVEDINRLARPSSESVVA
ncbi:hypothetical protein HF319_09295 [Xanthomonas sp. Kuri4-1]